MGVKAKKILIVDDEPDVIACYRSIFSSDRMTVVTADNGLQAFELVQNTAFDAIVTDLNMPHLHGVQLIACIKATDLNRHCPIIVVSSNLKQDVLPKLEAMKLVEAMSKPVDPGELKRKIESSIYPSRKQAIAYNPKYIDLFKQSGSKLLNFYFGLEPEVQEPYLRRKAEPFGAVTGVVNFFGPDFFGVLSISCDQSFVQDLASQLFGIEASEVDVVQFVDLVGELANQLGGFVKDHVTSSGMDVMLGIPFILAQDHKIPACVSSPKIAILYSIGRGNCRVEFALGDPQHLHLHGKQDTSDIFVYDSSKVA
ncbi:response regulator [Pseudobacteriovorax antillogorgiicola]|uniref:Chemotaxis phosphatase CheX n=1 Tax=Pseudobacteriovorax antillogorgiicola TaxID=1513793 RepID=A0A1Y6CPV2_9BACT|nr:response regulator [Pseudobacteriovorax antillogorgiicola]TCS46108.1 chemotaxis phosphatase CheX-like protein [Pseudobacteriovorax antillogorgiicola]SMF69437.1 Chemotaxis phosphatase CheX [Pseudobacteriovorax antillogorgiicola]